MVFDDFINEKVFDDKAERLFNSRELEICTTMQKMSELSKNRHENVRLLQPYSEYLPEYMLEELSSLLLEREKKWEEINLIFTKVLLSGKKKKMYMEKMIEQLQKLRVLEISCCNKIKEMNHYIDEKNGK